MRAFLIVALWTAAAGPIQAELIRAQLSGVITEVDFQVGTRDIIPLGTTFQTELIWDTDEPIAVIDSGRARYMNAIRRHESTILGTRFSWDRNAVSSFGTIFIDNNSVSSWDALRTGNLRFHQSDQIDGMSLSGSPLSLGDNSQTAFADTGLPTSLNLADFDIARQFFSFEDAAGNRTLYSGAVTVLTTSAVPEPAPLPVLLVSLTSVAVLLSKKKFRYRRTQDIRRRHSAHKVDGILWLKRISDEAWNIWSVNRPANPGN